MADHVLPPLDLYPDARQRFLTAAEAAGCVIEHHEHPLTGPNGSVLATDVARLGPPSGDTRAVVVVGSGTHGVEGHAGSGLQRLALADPRVSQLPDHVAVLFIHAINPYGLAWSRRVDHDNVDVNRNFIDFDNPPPISPLYPEIDPLLNPAVDELDLDDVSWLGDLAAFAERVGMNDAFQAVTGGQYEHPHGMQFGGTSPTWSRRMLEGIWNQHLEDTELVVNLDLHTGLGPNGQLTIFQTADPDETAAAMAARWFPEVLRADRVSDQDQLNRGVLGPGLDMVMGDRRLVVPIVVEFGTLDELMVLGAMRADNWLHHHGDPSSAFGEIVRARTREAFFVDDEAWRRQVAHDGMRCINAALDAAEAHDPR